MGPETRPGRPAAGGRPLARYALAVVAVVAALVIGLLVRSSPKPVTAVGDPPQQPALPGGSAPGHGRLVCGQRILRSPYHYTGKPGHYPSGTAGLPTYGAPGSDFPHATAGVVLAAGRNDYPSYKLEPSTVYYLLPGTHIGGFQADKNDAFVGGYANGVTSVLTGNYTEGGQAIDSNSTDGNQGGVTIEYLTIEKYSPDTDAAAINQEADTGWTIRYDTITLNVPGAGAILGADNVLADSCLTLNGQYGFQSTDVAGFSQDALTRGPYNVTVERNEISFNDTCDLEGTVTNPAIGWHNRNPVPARYRNPHCGKVSGDGNLGGFKLWQTNGVTIRDNVIHGNWGPGAWVDTNNANTTITGNTFTGNDGEAVIEETSYNFSITGNYIADNDWIGGYSNDSFPTPAIYISESGSDRMLGGVPACSEPSCARQPSYPMLSVISHNTLVDNGGSIFLWQSPDRYCSDGFDGACTLVKGGTAGPFTIAACKAHLPAARVDTSTFTGITSSAPAEDWWDGCQWKTENVHISHNQIDFDPARIAGCNPRAWPDCGAGGIFSKYGGPPGNEPAWITPTQLTFFSNDVWSDNVYNGPSTFYAWNQGNGDNPVSWGRWTGLRSSGDKCSSPDEHQSGYCRGPFGQDMGSIYRAGQG
jgi:parallel beta-helix repeat protein